MTNQYALDRITSETWRATCKKCGKPFRSDVKSKAVRKVLDHLRECKG